MVQAAKIALEEDRPIYLDYYVDSLEKKCCIGVKDTVKHLVKSGTEYTSAIEKLWRLKEENTWLVMTENSIYIVSSEIPTRKIS